MVKIPTEYKKGFIRFLGCKINLSKRTFIPRVETEYWVKKAIQELRIKNKNLAFSENLDSRPSRIRELKILDMFAGSGCIGIAILKACPEFCRRVDFADIDKKAISQIKINLKLNRISQKRYKIYRSNLFEKLKGKTYNFIFANPPYVAKDRIGEVQKSVLKYEPKKALFSGKKGLNYIKKLLEKMEKGKRWDFLDKVQNYMIELKKSCSPIGIISHF